jgi:S1-C subfamily serine protease
MKTPFAFASVIVAVLSTAVLGACRGGPTPTPDAAKAPGQSSPVLSSSTTPVSPLGPGARIEDERNTIAVFKEASPSTVFVTQTRTVTDFLGSEQEVPAGSGSGFVWDDQGHVVTNFHVVKGAESLVVTFQDQQRFDAKVVGVEPKKDIAVLKVNAPANLFKPVKVSPHADLEVGQKTIAIGNPFGLDHTLTTGIVSAVGRQVQGIGGVTIRDMIQTDAAINPGNSGGPLLDSQGQLIGMNTMIYSQSGSSAGIGFAVPVRTIARVVPQILKSGKAEQLGLGIGIDPAQRLERRFGIHGVVVVNVGAGSSAEKAGFKGLTRTARGVSLGDVIVSVAGQKVEDFDDLYNALDTKKAGDKVEVGILRDEKPMTLKADVIVLP